MRIISAIIILTAGAFSASPLLAQKTNVTTPKMRDITIYVYKRPPESSYGKLVPVTRRIIDYKPLDAAIKLLLRGANEREERMFELEDFIYGLDFYSARIKNKTAQINFKFQNPEIALESWEGGGFDHENFVKAVTKTAQQFAGVERVSICVDGMKNYTNFDSSIEDKCSFPMFPPAPVREPAADEMWDVSIFLNHEKATLDAMGIRQTLPVTRRVKAAVFLTETLKALDAGATEAEKKQGWSSSSYGTRFVSAIKINKKAYVKYTMPKGKKFPDKSAPQAFYFAVSDTVLQFRNEIEEIEVCLDGVSNFYAENQDQAVCDDLSQID